MDHLLITSLLLGLTLGITHALDPDHLMAMGTLAAESRDIRRSALLGAIWGVGHTCALALVGYLVLSLKWTIPLQMAAHMEVMVGAMIVALGVHLLWRTLQPWTVHHHEHHHEEMTHSHVHVHGQDHASHSHHLRSSRAKVLLVGFVHGVAGSAALTLAVLATMPSMEMGMLYILLFGMGSIGGMLLMSGLISLPFVLVSQSWHHNLKVSAGFLAIGFGAYFMWSPLS
ncbi:urease accessory protein UreH domain-containing protein [Nitrospira sp. T9]|uniref:urease accessory protein UreH domain-containing protein n=1 Tax=unclassified Nitrospira TaxID=2652172 RepID=UPI003F977117